MPARPLPSAPSKPTSWAASSRFGYRRRLSSTKPSAGSLELAHRRAMSGGQAPLARRRSASAESSRWAISRAESPRIGRQARASASRVLDLRGECVEGLGARGRHGEGLTVPVEDRAALGLERDGLGVLVVGEARVLVVLDDLDEREPRERGREGAGDEGGDDRASGSALRSEGGSAPLPMPPPTADCAGEAGARRAISGTLGTATVLRGTAWCVRLGRRRERRARGEAGAGRDELAGEPDLIAARATPCRARRGPCPRCARAT